MSPFFGFLEWEENGFSLSPMVENRGGGTGGKLLISFCYKRLFEQEIELLYILFAGFSL
jgi:hypothetical protein